MSESVAPSSHAAYMRKHAGRLNSHLRIVDQSGEDYMYPGQRFVAADLPVSTRRAVIKAA